MNKLLYLIILLLTLLAMPLASYAHCKGKHADYEPHCGGGGGGPSSLGDDYTATDGVEFNSPSDVGSFDYHIIGTPEEDEIYAGGGKDLIEGGGGTNWIFARGGDDEIHGDSGDGEISGGGGDDLIFGGEAGHNISGDEGDDIIFGGDGGGSIDGGEGADWLVGGDSVDYMRGGEGTDLLEGGSDDDRLYWSLGSLLALPDQYELDDYDGGPGRDSLDFSGENDYEIVESVTVDLSLSTYEAMARDPSGTLITVIDKFINIEGARGTSGDDELHGDDAGNALSGRGGNDIIYGDGGNDALGTDWPGSSIVYGGSGNDRIAAWGDNDVLFSEAGNDLIEGHAGDDEMHGGAGCDGFQITGDSGTDTIMDFEACDLIYLKFSSHYRVSFSNVKINDVGDDIIIDIVVKRGGTGGTIILKDALLNGVTVNESTFRIGWPGARPATGCDPSRYWCEKD